jgi:hypothetical protein
VPGRGAVEADAVPQEHGRDVDRDLVDEVGVKALGGQVGAEDLEVLAAGRVLRGGDVVPARAGEDRAGRSPVVSAGGHRGESPWELWGEGVLGFLELHAARAVGG